MKVMKSGYVCGRLRSKTLASRFCLPQAAAEKWVKEHEGKTNLMPAKVVSLKEIERAAATWASWRTQARKLQQA